MGVCRECGVELKKRISAPNVHIFKPYWHYNLDVKPVWIESKKQGREEAAKRGFRIPYLED